VKPALRTLFVEDREDDALLTLAELETAYDVTWQRVETAPALESALAAHAWDLIVSDWAMPQFDGLSAFRVFKRFELEVPFIIVSGTISEDIAVDALKSGVHDFMSKGSLARFLPAVERELRDAEGRKQRRSHELEIARQREEIARSERLLRTLVDTVPDGVLMIGADDRVLLRNRALAAFELDRAQMFRADRATPLAPDEQAHARALRGEAIDAMEVFLRHPAAPDGMWASVSARPLRDDGDRIAGAVATYRDTTREHASHEQLMISDRMASVGLLAAGVGHEINNPLAAALINLELIERVIGANESIGGAELELVRAMLKDSLTAAERVREIVRDLRIFARHEDVTLAPVSLEGVLDSSLRMAWNEIRHRARLERDYAGAPMVHGSESRLGQVFLNLIVNAAQAIVEGDAEHNVIRVKARAEGDERVLVEISDSGAGIPADVMHRLFTPFFTTKPVGVGTGLGLAICHHIVKTLGGDIQVDSELGAGTTFRVSLPVARPVETSTPPPPAPAPPALRRGRVLVIDDEALVATAISRTLSHDHDVVVETRAAKALDRIVAGERFDVVLCDLMMPHMNGMELFAELERRSPDHAARVVFLTGGAFTPAARAFLERVDTARVEKPVDAAALRALVAERVR
jgi:signal transduction histidine kinase